MNSVIPAAVACAIGLAQASANGATLEIHTTAARHRPAPRAHRHRDARPGKQPPEGEVSVFVDPGKTYPAVAGHRRRDHRRQRRGVRQAVAERAGAPAARVLRRPDGIGYSLARTTIHSSDFSSASYTYIAEGDATLDTFSVAHDRQFRIPLIKRAIAAAGGHLTLFASPWSAPAFMKTNGSMLQGGQLKPEFADAWARYFTRFIRAYEQEGIPVWGITIQNEPMATQRWESMIFSAEDERDFLKNHLGPAMAQAGLGDRKIIVWDHNRDLMTQRARVIFEDPEASKYAWGMGFHWYETWAGGAPMFANVGAVHQRVARQAPAADRGHRRRLRSGAPAVVRQRRALRHRADQRLQQRRRRLDRLEHPARREGRPEPRRQLLLRAGARGHPHRRAHVHAQLLVPGPLLEVHPPGRASRRGREQPQQPRDDGVHQPRTARWPPW